MPLLYEKKAKINLLEVVKTRGIAYFALDTQSYPETAMHIGKMITQDINTVSGMIESTWTDAEKRPTSICVDEFQAFGTKGFLNALNRGRSSGFWVTIAHQSIADLKAVDPSFAQQVVDSTNSKLFLRVNDPDTAKSFCDSLGTQTTVRKTEQILIQGDDPKNIMGNVAVVEEYKIHPSELINLPTSRAVFKGINRYGRLVLPTYTPKLF